MNKLYILLFLTIFSSIYLGIHYYVYSRIAGGLMLSAAACLYLRTFFLAAAFSFLLSEFLSRYIDYFWIKPLIYFGSLWLGILSISVTVFLITDIIRIFFHSQNLRYYLTLISLASILVLSAVSVLNALRSPLIKELEIKSRKLPQELSGFTIVQLSDTHLYFVSSEKQFEKIVRQTNGINADIIVITGDLVDSDISRQVKLYALLKEFKSKYGVYAVTGNHENYSGIDKFIKLTNDSGITVLRNEHRVVADSIELAGIDDTHDQRNFDVVDNIKSALKNCDFKKPVILLSHQPDVFDEAVKMGVDLQLSGHTHAGQIPPMDIITMFYFKYPYGLYRKNSSYLYTTSGTGIWGPPMRLFSRSEIVKITLKK